MIPAGSEFQPPCAHTAEDIPPEFISPKNELDHPLHFSQMWGLRALRYSQGQRLGRTPKKVRTYSGEQKNRHND